MTRIRVAVLLVVTAALVAVTTVGWSRSVASTRWFPGGTAAPVSTPEAAAAGPPKRLRIPALGMDVPLGTVGLDQAGAIAAPKDYAQAAWYDGGTAPGDPGPAVIVGHVDSTNGPAVFFDLPRLRTGDTIDVERDSGTVRFTVVAVRQYPKDDFPTAEVHAATPGPELRLITCGGDFNRRERHYTDNIVVYAIVV
ncbi:class F sortase [Virgisporangium aliadipatigenens]|uniref:Class F sortase n=1 Tax=Virgisporangium aliadipatigenens TaxID=741659 RepID=A0A8J3YR87_9ACTN|nr:class F sortase [Virgisporangium aliadipatigenens]GIJ49142.1 class F sortase [Virgisporangium aliadipatigenens]